MTYVCANKLIANAKRIAVVAHENPDADTLGSCSALYTYLLQLHKKVHFVCETRTVSKRYNVIPWVEKIKHTLPSSTDLVIVCDAAQRRRCGLQFEQVCINFDHHRSNTYFCDCNVVNPSAMSTTEVVYDFLRSNEAKINAKIATAIYAGLISDTRRFATIDKEGMVFALAKELVAYGADHENVVNRLQKYSTLSQLRLLGSMFQEMRLVRDGRIAVFRVDRRMLHRSGADENDAKAALEKALELPTVALAVMIVRRASALFKVSLRSQTIDVAAIARAFGGGGHKNRAGIVFENEENFEVIEKKLLEEVKIG